MLTPLTYFIVLAAVSGYAFLRGRADERVAVAICIAATIATNLVVLPLHARYSGVETGILLIDVLTLAGFTLLALRSDRFWPLWVAGFQLTTVLSHLIKAIDFDLMPQAYAAAARFWVYPIFLIIVVGTWRAHRRRVDSLAPRANTA
ncbi:MAG: hypothetical protein M3Q57_04895 [Pseudomonadota bacterium]|nr:hypothetical protein [Pseudomonadota bacterium]